MEKISKGLFITIEGIDGSGKSTQAKKISHWLQDFTGHESIRTFEPGDWSGGKILRDLILKNEDFEDFSELFLFLADRAGHLKNLILPALEENKNVICERYNASTIAYQSGGHGLGFEAVKKIIEACNFPEPDLIILLDVDPEVAVKRIKKRNIINNKNNKSEDKFESEGINLMRRVYDAYNNIAEENRERFLRIKIDEFLDEDEIFKKIISGIKGKFKI